jgi:hypothetical protein
LIEIDELSTSSRAIAKEMKTGYVTCSNNGFVFRISKGFLMHKEGSQIVTTNEKKQLKNS